MASTAWRPASMPSSPISSPPIWKPVTCSAPWFVVTTVLKKPVQISKTASNRSPARNSDSPCAPRARTTRPRRSSSSRDLLARQAIRSSCSTCNGCSRIIGWPEEDWVELAPQLRAVANGQSWYAASTSCARTCRSSPSSTGITSRSRKTVVYPASRRFRHRRSAAQPAPGQVGRPSLSASRQIGRVAAARPCRARAPRRRARPPPARRCRATRSRPSAAARRRPSSIITAQ